MISYLENKKNNSVLLFEIEIDFTALHYRTGFRSIDIRIRDNYFLESKSIICNLVFDVHIILLCAMNITCKYFLIKRIYSQKRIVIRCEDSN